MSIKDELPSPFKTFIGILLFQGSVFAFFVENKQQTIVFYGWSVGFFILNSLASAILVGMLKRPGSPFAFSIGAPDHVVNKIFAERRRERWGRRFQMLVVFSIWICSAYFIANEMYLHFKIKS